MGGAGPPASLSADALDEGHQRGIPVWSGPGRRAFHAVRLTNPRVQRLGSRILNVITC